MGESLRANYWSLLFFFFSILSLLAVVLVLANPVSAAAAKLGLQHQQHQQGGLGKLIRALDTSLPEKHKHLQDLCDGKDSILFGVGLRAKVFHISFTSRVN